MKWPVALLSCCLASCAAGKSLGNSDRELTFRSFLDQAEGLALEHRVWSAPSGLFPSEHSDFLLESVSTQGNLFAKYTFAALPCVSRNVVEEQAVRLGYVKAPKGEPTSHADPLLNDLYNMRGDRYGRSLNAEFWPESKFHCLQVIFIDYPR